MEVASLDRTGDNFRTEKDPRESIAAEQSGRNGPIHTLKYCDELSTGVVTCHEKVTGGGF